MIEEVIECEIGNINIQHPEPVEINNDISLPLKDEKLAQLQESDPHTNQLRKQWENNNLDVGVSRRYTDHHQGRAIHMADSRID